MQNALPTTGPQSALLIVDVQRDFLPGGSLAVAEGERVLAPLQRAITHFHTRQGVIVCSRCWHPPNHCSFHSRGGPWPEHCIAGTPGAEFAPGLALPPDALIVSKASEPDRESYSAFDGTDLDLHLRRLKVADLWVGGLATDYCVLRSVLDARNNGYAVYVLQDAVRAVELAPGDGQRALQSMAAAGARLVSVEDLTAC